MIYFDNNATTRIDPQVLDAMLPWLSEEYGNPSSVYALGRRAASALEDARGQIAALLGCESRELTFTSCGSESINAAIRSALLADPDRAHVVTSAVEHSATLKLCESFAKRGYEVTRVGVDRGGLLDLEALENSIREDTAIVSLLWANNETGVLFPVAEIAEICLRKKVPLHIDAVQAVGKLPLAVSELPISFLSLSGHKFHSPKGVAALYVNRRSRFHPWLIGGSQENGRRGGTQNMASIVGMGKAAEIAATSLQEENKRVRSLRDRLEDALLSEIPDAEINGDCDQRLPNTTNIAFEGIESEGALLLLDEAGICCSAGSACTSGSVHPSHVLKAMGFSDTRARASLRFSLGRFNSTAEIDRAIEVIPSVIDKLRRLSPAGALVAA